MPLSLLLVERKRNRKAPIGWSVFRGAVSPAPAHGACATSPRGDCCRQPHAPVRPREGTRCAQGQSEPCAPPCLSGRAPVTGGDRADLFPALHSGTPRGRLGARGQREDAERAKASTRGRLPLTAGCGTAPLGLHAPSPPAPRPADTFPLRERPPAIRHCGTLASAAGRRPNPKTAVWADSRLPGPQKLPTLGTSVRFTLGDCLGVFPGQMPPRSQAGSPSELPRPRGPDHPQAWGAEGAEVPDGAPLTPRNGRPRHPHAAGARALCSLSEAPGLFFTGPHG